MTRVILTVLVAASFLSTAKLALGAEGCYYDQYLKREVCGFMKPIVPQVIDKEPKSNAPSRYIVIPKDERRELVCRRDEWRRAWICR